VNEVKRQAVAELQRAVAAAESKACELVATERAKMEKLLLEARKQAAEEALAAVVVANQQQQQQAESSEAVSALPAPSQQNASSFYFTFMGLCIVSVFKHNQQDATLHNDIYYYKCSTCFRRFLRPSSGAQNCIHGIGYLSSFYCLLLLA